MNEAEKQLWKGHLDKKCPKCGAELELRQFRTSGYGSTDNSEDLLDNLADLMGVTPPDIHIIYYVACACRYQKRTYEFFMGNPIESEEKKKKKKEFSENIKKQIL